MHRPLHRIAKSLLPWAAGLVPILLAGAAGARQAGDPAPRPTLAAAPIAQPPALDGDVAGDPAWMGLPAAAGFVQTTPDEGRPATERTEVFVAFDESRLYIGVICHDRDPDGIIISDSRRDASLSETDSFRVLLDTFGDRQTGFVFGTNPAGIQYDGQVTGDGEGSMGAAGGFNLDWDGAWQVAARVHEGGWSAEMAIPFRTLRFAPGSGQTWGLNFQRNIRRRNETAFWSPLPRQMGLERVSLAGTLSGVEVPRQRLLQLTPYLLAEAREGVDGTDASDEDFEAGFDLKVGLTPALTLDATVNTDFAQVEADVQQINLDRFSLFFPEKRPFFLENAGLFGVGVSEEIELFFSRRIGIGPSGQDIPILGGLRLSGKAGRTNLGLLAMGTDEVEGIAPEERFAVVRVSQDLGERSSLGLIATHRQAEGAADEPGDRRTYGVDGRWGFHPNAELVAFAARTETPGESRDEHAFRLGGSWDSEVLDASINYSEVGEGFDPAVGFVSRTGFRKADGFVLVRHRPEGFLGLHELRPHISYRGFWDFDGFQETGFLHIDNHWEWSNGHEVHTGINFTREGVKVPFEIAPGVVVPAGTYDHSEIALVAFTNRGAPVSGYVRIVKGGFFGGDRLAVRPSALFRFGEKVNGEVAWTYNDIELPGGAFETHLGRLRLSYSWSTDVFVDALAQYNDRRDQWSANVRFGWRHDASTGFFLVYDEIQEVGRLSGEAQRRLILKFSRLFDLLGG
ncbi:MAG: carbohydrate binding family 9 domain-containing protein [Holophagales bacterium]|nr:carbohydrate binding family 9 domain-containing protein [Holophagales bacterium]